MRRRERDVFELGEEQLLEEPAVELAEAEGPSVTPPTRGPESEARGSEDLRPGARSRLRSLPRVPGLDTSFLRGRVVAGVGVLALGGAAFAVLSGAPDEGEVESTPAPKAPQVSGGPARELRKRVASKPGSRPARERRRVERRQDRRSEQQRRASTDRARPKGRGGSKAETIVPPQPEPVSPVPASPSPSVPPATVPSEPAPAPGPIDAGRGLIEREFGL